MKSARARVEGLARSLQEVFGDDLVGIYLHGSLALGCFNPALSDLDLLVITKRAPSPEHRQALDPLLLAHGGRIELHVLAARSLGPWRHPASYELHFSSKAGLVGPGEDHDLAAHIYITRQVGVALIGPRPADVFPEVPWEDYEDSLRRDLVWSRERGDELYDVLSPARIWATLTERAVHSKASGAAWALERAPAEFQPLLSRALESYRSGTTKPVFGPEEIRRFADFVSKELDSTRLLE